MKTVKIATLLISLLLFTTNTQAQVNYYNTTDTVFQFVDKRPEFPGGMTALMAFFAENIIHPAEVRDTGWQGRVVVQFVVRKTGEITDVRTFHEVFPPLDKEAVRVAKLMPHWIPGEHNGEKVNVKYILPINLNVQPFIDDTAPQFPGGDEALLQYLLDNIQYPPCAEEGLSFGRVVLQFSVLKSGEISDVEVISGVAPKLDAEVVRVVEAMPNWIPAKRDGEKVDALFQLPVSFMEILQRNIHGINVSELHNLPGFSTPEEKQPGDFVFPIIVKMPYFPGGEAALMRFLNRMQYPSEAARRGAEGRVAVSFVVKTDGRTEDIQIVESNIFFPSNRIGEPGELGRREASIRWSMEQEAIRVIRAMPNWLPAEQMGEKVNFRFTLPIVFRLQ